jgi:hypothetical protein
MRMGRAKFLAGCLGVRNKVALVCCRITLVHLREESVLWNQRAKQKALPFMKLAE